MEQERQEKQAQNNVVAELNAELQRIRDKRNALPLQEQIDKRKAEMLTSLQEIGYITSDEAEEYSKPLEDLPTDRKGLVIAYVCRSGYIDAQFTTNEFEETRKHISKFELANRGFGDGDKTIADLLTESEQEDFIRGTRSILDKQQVGFAERWVDTKRRALRTQLLPILRRKLALAILNEAERAEGELDPTPYLMDELKDNGYRENAKSLNDGDKQALTKVTEEYLDLLELAYLNGIGAVRQEAYKKYLSEDESKWIETFMYEDYFDEALTEYGDIYYLFELTKESFYTNDTAKDMREFLKELPSKVYDNEEYHKEDIDRIKASKFSYLLD